MKISSKTKGNVIGEDENVLFILMEKNLNKEMREKK